MRLPIAPKIGRQSGFTLVELMIVVAIIGILASIAIPNYQKYQAKSRTSESKIQLASAYTAQKSFYIEYGSYTGCIGAAGYAPDLGSSVNRSIRYYATGIATAGAVAAASCGPTAAAACDATWSNGNPTCANRDGTVSGNPPSISNATYWSANMSSFPGSIGAAATQTSFSSTFFIVSSTTFILAAAGNVNPSTNGVYDQWTINDGKVLTQINVGY